MAFREWVTLVGAAAALAVATSTAAAAPVKTPAPAAGVAADRLVDPASAAIRQAVAEGLGAGIFTSKREAAAIAEYYAAQGYVPSWTADGRLTDRARAIIRRIAAAGADGLDPAAYRTPLPGLGAYVPIAPATLARAAVLLTRAIAAYAGAAYSGRLEPKSISDNFGYEIQRLDPAVAVGLVAASDDPAATLAAFNPPQEEFAALRAKLAELRSARTETPPEIPSGPLLKLGVSDPRVVLIRERFGVPTDVAAPEVYDEAVIEAVKTFQASAKLKADGIVGNATLAVMNRGAKDQVATVIANMERWRWMPRDLGDFYVRVNIPNFNVEIHENGTVIHETRIVVGKTTNQTPIFSDEIEHVVVNPVWNVPASIALKEMLPTIRANGGNIRGYQVYANIKGRFRAVDPRMIDWHTVDMRKIQIKQPPGERNALGAVKFMFPNKYAVYLHDTPSKSLFQRDYRAYSHGCMRVMDPWSFADALLSRDPGWNAARLKKLVGGPERRVDLPHHINVHITYFTAWVDADGTLQVRDDIYGHDKRIEKALGL